MKPYSNKQNARRAARQALEAAGVATGIEGVHFIIEDAAKGGFFYKLLQPGEQTLVQVVDGMSMPAADTVEGSAEAGEAARRRANANAGKPANPTIGYSLPIAGSKAEAIANHAEMTEAARFAMPSRRQAKADPTIASQPDNAEPTTAPGWHVDTTPTEGTVLKSPAGEIAATFYTAIIDDEQIARLVDALNKPARARKERAPRPEGGENKRDICKAMLLQPAGCTSADLLAATGWPTISVPAVATASGLILRKHKDGKVTRYFGYATEAEAEAADAASAQGKAA